MDEPDIKCLEWFKNNSLYIEVSVFAFALILSAEVYHIGSLIYIGMGLMSVQFLFNCIIGFSLMTTNYNFKISDKIWLTAFIILTIMNIIIGFTVDSSIMDNFSYILTLLNLSLGLLYLGSI